ncbi:MAG TPA: 6-phosphogluconolactonase [Devosiaceae bacterium]
MPERRDFETREELAKALADAVAEDLRAGIAARGVATLAVSGGSTPAKFFARLGKHKDVDWDKVIVTLVDERWVPETYDRSNAMLVNEKMLQGPAAVARFIPLYQGGERPDAAGIAKTIAAIGTVPSPFDAVVLGMGNDGHTASFFPGGDTLAAALDGDAVALAINAPDAGEPRVTLSRKRLLQTRSLYLHIEGEEKVATLDKALGEGPVEAMPIRAMLRQTDRPLIIYWAP